MTKIISTNPAKNYKVIGEVQASSDVEIYQTVEKAQKAKRNWKETSLTKRIELLKSVLKEFKKRSNEIATLMTNEMGKPISQSKFEVESYLEEFSWNLKNVTSLISSELSEDTSEQVSTITYEPYGVAAVITPWNFPFGISITGIVPNLLVGNTVIYKPSEETTLLGRLIAQIFSSHRLPDGVFNILYGAGDVGEKLVKSNIDFIWFTGSTTVGQKLYKIAAEKSINVLLEMGGSSPCIIFEDVDIEKAVEIVYESRFLNTGQACDVTKRLIVHESIFDQTVNEMSELLKSKNICDPCKANSDLGSLVAKKQLDFLEQQVNDSVSAGAKIITGGRKLKGLKGAYYEPTILININRKMRVWNEEVFGPVLPIIKFNTEEEAVELANDTKYGLGAKVITKDLKRARRVASKIEAGTIEINSADRWTSPNNPFGGYKKSGIGCENGSAGFKQLCQIKLISESK